MQNYLFQLAWCLSSALALDCTLERFQSHLPGRAQVQEIRAIAKGGTFEVPSRDVAYPTSPTGLRALCAVQVNVISSPTSTYSFGLFLPYDWNHRFLAVGNGGFAGGINWIDMGAGVGYGFATMSTDTGHNSTLLDSGWAYKHEEARIDWGYRALHGSVEIAKGLVDAYYGREAKWNYYSGCSTGGRQGLKEIQKYPDDFDGVLAGAPAWWQTHLSAWTIQLALYNLPTNAIHHIPASLFASIGAEVIRQCDAIDGVEDGILTNPDSCHFIPELMLCSHNVTNQIAAGCLTAPQIDTLYKIYGAYVDCNKTFVFPGMELGSEALWSEKLGSTKPNALGSDFPPYFLDFGSNWNFYDYNDSILHLADMENPGGMNANDYDLGSFRQNGGKVITYHGLADGRIPPHSTEYFYKSVLKTLGVDATELGSFYRHFYVPGLQHCVRTPATVDAPWYIAGGNQAAILGTSVHSVPGFEDADHDALLALMAWTENGTAPERIVATKWVNDTMHDTVLRQRPVCSFPKLARYDGDGDPDRPGSWSCTEPWVSSPSVA